MSQAQPPPFHLAFPVTDLDATRRFYVELLGCREGRSTTDWLDLDLQGHQLSAHRVETMPALPTNDVDGCQVPVAHFGLVLSWPKWQMLVERLRNAGVDFLIEPCIRYQGQPAEQATFFLLDPSGNGLEFKAFRDPAAMFA